MGKRRRDTEDGSYPAPQNNTKNTKEEDIMIIIHEGHEKQEVLLNQFPEKKWLKTLKTPNFFSEFSVFSG